VSVSVSQQRLLETGWSKTPTDSCNPLTLHSNFQNISHAQRRCFRHRRRFSHGRNTREEDDRTTTSASADSSPDVTKAETSDGRTRRIDRGSVRRTSRMNFCCLENDILQMRSTVFPSTVFLLKFLAQQRKGRGVVFGISSSQATGCGLGPASSCRVPALDVGPKK
jgi:hypothetical protein